MRTLWFYFLLCFKIYLYISLWSFRLFFFCKYWLWRKTCNTYLSVNYSFIQTHFLISMCLCHVHYSLQCCTFLASLTQFGCLVPRLTGHYLWQPRLFFLLHYFLSRVHTSKSVLLLMSCKTRSTIKCGYRLRCRLSYLCPQEMKRKQISLQSNSP